MMQNRSTPQNPNGQGAGRMGSKAPAAGAGQQRGAPSGGKNAQSEPRKTVPAAEPKVKLSKEARKNRLESMMNEYIGERDAKELKLTLSELGAPEEIVKEYVTICLEQMCECKEATRRGIFEAIVDIAKLGLAPLTFVEAAFTDFTEFLPDIKIDLPNVDAYVGTIFGLMLHAGVFTGSNVAALLRPMAKDEFGMVAAMLGAIFAVLKAEGSVLMGGETAVGGAEAKEGDAKTSAEGAKMGHLANLVGPLVSRECVKDKFINSAEERLLAAAGENFSEIGAVRTAAAQVLSTEDPAALLAWLEANVDGTMVAKGTFVLQVSLSVLKMTAAAAGGEQAVLDEKLTAYAPVLKFLAGESVTRQRQLLCGVQEYFVVHDDKNKGACGGASGWVWCLCGDLSFLLFCYIGDTCRT